MNIRKKIFLSYIFFILLAVVLSLGLMFFSFVQKRIDRDIQDLYTAREIWNDLLVSMNNLQFNWADGETYREFYQKYYSLENLLSDMSELKKPVPFSGSYDLNDRRQDLYRTWSMAAESILKIVEIVESPDFIRVVKEVEKQPGLQRLNHLWMELFYSEDPGGEKDAYILGQLIDQIEFFPIYSETLNHLFRVIIKETDHIFTRIETTRLVMSILFFALFLLIYMSLALRFSGSISKPIIDMSVKLSAFMGRNLKIESYSHTDELELLSFSVNNLIEHYTYLSELAGRLAVGELNSPIMDLREQGVVGNALKDINRYLQELAETSEWIKDGNYGAEVRVKSDVDILAQNFNIMSRVIFEKITTLSNMFDAVNESIVVIDKDGRFIEANGKFFQLIRADNRGRDGLPEGTLHDYLAASGPDTENCMKMVQNPLYTELKDLKDVPIPVKIIPRPMPKIPGRKDNMMLFITNESVRVRVKREREKLKAHAMEAELRALRAQINPHFLFNTLNAIAHLVESRPEGAVHMIEKLSDLFRYSLASTRRNLVSLAEELDIIRQFFDIEKLRFGDTLSVEYEVEEGLENHAVPPMLIQPIVENAVKYGIDENGEIHIHISISRKGSGLLITVSDRGSLVVDHPMLLKQKGTGIRNVNQRLKSLYNRQLSFIQNEPRGLKVLIKIPGEGSRDDKSGSD